MKPTSDVVALVVDHGLFPEVALRLARDFKRVLYFSPWSKGFPMLNDCCIGDGFDEIERCDSIWDALAEIDLAVFPDIQDSDIQLELEERGIPLWGSRRGDELELKRRLFLKTLRELDLPVPPHRMIQGLDELRLYLMQHSDKFIKISKWRGTMETWHHIDFAQSETLLDQLAVELGPMKNKVPFMVCDPIETDLEIGYDGYCIDGQFPALSSYGIEIKDRSLIATIVKQEDLPEQVVEINEAFSSVLKEYRYRNFWSTELRIKGDESFFIDPCCRAPSPSIEVQMELYDNFGDIIWHGANGECIDPKPTAQFAVEALMIHKGDKSVWRPIDIPDKIRQYVKLYKCCKIDGLYHVPPIEPSLDEVGAVIGLGDTIQEAIEHLKENVAELGDAPVKVDVDSLAKAIEEIHTLEEQGVPFTDQTVPKPEIVIQDA